MAVFALTLVRHGETTCNKERILQGQKDTELSVKGMRQAELAGQKLQFEQFTHVYCSDLQRAFKTCEIILAENKIIKPTISIDERLRERKFGDYEGRPTSEFHSAAKKEKKKFMHFVPEGGESTGEVRSRAISFFQDMCDTLRQLLWDKDNNCLEVPPGGIKRRRHTSSSTDVFSSSGSPVDNMIETSHEDKNGHSNSGSTSSTSGCSSLTTVDSSEQLADPISPSLLALDPKMVSSSHDSTESMERDSEDNLSASSLSSMHHPTFDLEIKTNITPPKGAQYGCPNVSLSPIFEHRLSSMSSVSSGRNSSFDEGDQFPKLLADVLVVTHGGFMKELVSYFSECLDCKIPGGNSYAYQVSPNTGMSKFTITLSESKNEHPLLTCLTIHDKDHLISEEVEALTKTEEV